MTERTPNPGDATLLSYDWSWRDFGCGPMLCTGTGGARTVLSTVPAPTSRDWIGTRDFTGLLRPVLPTDPIAVAIASTPKLIRTLRIALEKIDEEIDRRQQDDEDWSHLEDISRDGHAVIGAIEAACAPNLSGGGA